MMKDEHILNSILEWHIENQYKDGLLDPELVAKKLNIEIDSKTAYLMCAMMRDDGYLYKVKDDNRVYFANYRAKIFLKEGGYRQVFKAAKRKKRALWISDYFDIIIKPLTVISLIVGITWGSLKIYELISKCG